MVSKFSLLCTVSQEAPEVCTPPKQGVNNGRGSYKKQKFRVKRKAKGFSRMMVQRYSGKTAVLQAQRATKSDWSMLESSGKDFFKKMKMIDEVESEEI